MLPQLQSEDFCLGVGPSPLTREGHTGVQWRSKGTGGHGAWRRQKGPAPGLQPDPVGCTGKAHAQHSRLQDSRLSAPSPSHWSESRTTTLQIPGGSSENEPNRCGTPLSAWHSRQSTPGLGGCGWDLPPSSQVCLRRCEGVKLAPLLVPRAPCESPPRTPHAAHTALLLVSQLACSRCPSFLSWLDLPARLATPSHFLPATLTTWVVWVGFSLPRVLCPPLSQGGLSPDPTLALPCQYPGSQEALCLPILGPAFISLRGACREPFPGNLSM